MKNVDALIIGGSAAGFSAAITARRHYPEATVAVIRQEAKASVPCGIPYIFGTVGSPHENLISDTPLETCNIDLALDEVVDLEPETRRLTTKRGKEIEYEKLILATGSLPMIPPIPGLKKDHVFPVFKELYLI